MKRLFLTIALNVIFFFQLNAANANLFVYDISKIESEFSELNNIEEKLLNNQEVFNSKISYSGFENSLLNQQNLEREFKGGAFVLGLCLGVPGVAITYLLNEEDKDALRSGVQGYLTHVILYYGCFIAYYFSVIASMNSGTI